jgi:predicted ABC-type exoprotein transport system permease subunit
MMVNDMTRWETLVALVLLIPVFWEMGKGLRNKLQHPFMFTLFAFLLVSSNVVPPFFAVANIGAGRLRALAWMEFVLMLVLTTFYLTAWARQQLEESILGEKITDGVAGKELYSDGNKSADDIKGNGGLGARSSMIIATCLAFLMFGSAIMVIPNMQYYCCTSALSDLLDGTAATYKSENAERLRILKDDSIKDAELMEYSVHPELLFYEDVTPDTAEWINGATAKYYYKDSVVLINR